MRFVLVDEDHLMTEIVEAMLRSNGHEVVGVVDTTADAVHLLHAVRPDVVIIDMSLGYNTDYDALGAALDVGARAIVFSYNADDAVLSRYAVRPVFVPKPDLPELERVVGRLVLDTVSGVVDHDRRVRPARAASGPEPTSLADTQAFYVAMNNAIEGDGLVSLDLAAAAPGSPDSGEIGERVKEVLRETDRLLVSVSSVRVLLPGAGTEGIASFFSRLEAARALPPGATTSSVVVGTGELPADAFDRLKRGAVA